MKKRILGIVLLIAMVIFCEQNANASDIVGADKIKTTAYNISGTTASGCQTRNGICAGQDWMVQDAIEEDGSWVAMIWTEDGTEFLGYYEVLDKGGTDAIKKGHVIDVWFETLDECQEWMTKTKGKCIVKYVWSVG